MALRRREDGTYLSQVKRKPEQINTKWNSEEYGWLNQSKYVLNQPKDSTAVKQLAELGSKVILGDPIGKIYYAMAEMVIENKRKNKRTGLEAEFI